MKKFYVYIHLFPNGKRYVGKTTQTPEMRWKGGSGYRNQLVYNEIKKYGWENIIHQVIECKTEEEVNYLERYLITYYDTTNHDKGYNCSTGGEKSATGCKRTQEEKDHLRQINTGKKRSPESIAKTAAANRGKPHPHKPETIEKWRVSNPKKSHTAWNKGKKGEYHTSLLNRKREKQKWLTPSGEIREMNISHVKQHHPDWTRIE